MYGVRKVFRVIACCDLDLWPFDPTANRHIYEPINICDENWVKFPSLVYEVMVFTRFFWTHKLTRSRTSLTHGRAVLMCLGALVDRGPLGSEVSGVGAIVCT